MTVSVKTAVLGQPWAFSGHCWTAIMPLGAPPGDATARPLVKVLEDGSELPCPGSLLDDIVRHGEGRHCHAGRYLYFSASDNSSPLTNGRRYEIAVEQAGELYSGPQADQASYALSTVENYLGLFARHGIDPKASRVLEIGPGGSLGAQLLLADLVAEMIVADRYLTPWKDRHEEQYRYLLAGCGREAPHLRQALERRSVEGVLTTHAEPAEDLAGLADGSVDVVMSNAVLEHVEDIDKALRELRRVSRPGAWHFHQIDLRDHWDQSRPLEHLLLSGADFHETRVQSRFDRGCQWRLGDILANIAAAGLQVVEVSPNLQADDRYLADLLPRLRASDSHYARYPEDDLRVLSAFVVLRAGHADTTERPMTGER